MKHPGNRMPLLAASLLALGTALAFGFTAACDGGAPPRTSYITETNRGQEGTPIDGARMGFRLQVREAAVTDSVEFVLTNWDAGTVVFFLLTEEQRELGFVELRDADKVVLGEVEIESSELSFEFELASSYQTQDGNTHWREAIV